MTNRQLHPGASVSELFDTHRIPEDPRFWESLAAQIAANAIRRGRGSALGWFAYSQASRAAALIAVAAALAFAITGRSGTPGSPVPDWTAAVSPGDELGMALALSPAPPPIDGLLFGSPAPAAGIR